VHLACLAHIYLTLTLYNVACAYKTERGQELANKGTDLAEELFKLKFQHGIRQLDNTAKLGQLKKEMFYKSDRPVGIAKEYYQNNRIKLKETYQDGRKTNIKIKFSSLFC